MNLIRHESYSKNHVFKVHWRLGTFCNYHCSYCPSHFNNGSMESFIDINIAKAVIDNVVKQRPNDNVVFCFMGGEVTVYPHFVELLQYVNEKQGTVSFMTNGSRSLAYYKQVAGNLRGKAVFSYHDEFADIEKFIANAHVFPRTSITVLIPISEDNWDNCVERFERLYQEGFNVFPKHLIDKLGFVGQVAHTYTPEHIKYLKEANQRALRRLKTKNFTEHASVIYSSKNAALKQPYKFGGNFVELTYDNDTTEIISVHQLHIRNLANTRGMECYAGVEQIVINERGEVFKASCHQGGIIDNVYVNTNFKIPTDPIICGKAQCCCPNDLRLTKCVIPKTN